MPLKWFFISNGDEPEAEEDYTQDCLKGCSYVGDITFNTAPSVLPDVSPILGCSYVGDITFNRATSDSEDGIRATSDLEDVNIEMAEASVECLLDRVKNGQTHAKKPPTIYKAPSVLRDVSPSSFNPRVVSIGPLHKDDENVQAFEMLKANYLNDLMRRVSRVNPEHEKLTLPTCVEKAYASMTKIKACYVWNWAYGADDKVAEMMVMDTCFILEFLLKIWLSIKQPFEGSDLLLTTVLYDLVLLENQIPLFFLNEIFKCTVSKVDPDLSLITLISPILKVNNLFKADIHTQNISIIKSHHILSLLHECYAPQDKTDASQTDPISLSNSDAPKDKTDASQPDPFSLSNSDAPEDKIDASQPDPFSLSNSVVNLDRAGVTFEPNQNLTWVMGMEAELSKFSYFCGCWSKPTLRMPILHVHDSTEMLLRNLIAYEQSFQTPNFVTSYAIAMDMLVNTEEDVVKLVESRMLVNNMGSNKEAADMINNVCKNVIVGEFSYKEPWKTLNDYCSRAWPKHIVKMRNTYFNSPWSMIALLAGIMLFALTVVQTIFTIIEK